jgi:FMN phosphatase YigB (HAD superfamily)
MTLTVLFDLDDALLNTNKGEFPPAYFNGLGQALSHLSSQETIIKQIGVAVEKMVENQDPSRFLKEVFAENFYPPLGNTEENCQAIIDCFYAGEFPKLQALVEPKPEACKLIQWCKTQNMRLAIAINPLFPETATRQRIIWAGLKPEDFYFFLTFHNFHFTKPTLCFYAEALGRLGWPEGPLLMVGDDLVHDLLPVEEIGLKTCWVNPMVVKTKKSHGVLSAVRGLLSYLQETKEESELSSDPEVLLAELRSTPAVINTWLETLNRDALHHAPAVDEWSINEALWHLADFEEQIYLRQREALLKDPDRIEPQIETSRWAEERDYASREPEETCQRFLDGRMASLEKIETLLDRGFFNRAVHHNVFNETKISELVDFSARHDRLHLRQW